MATTQGFHRSIRRVSNYFVAGLGLFQSGGKVASTWVDEK